MHGIYICASPSRFLYMCSCITLQPVTADNAPEILRGSDIVGSLARVRLEKKRGGPAGAGSVIEVRIARSSIARIKPLSEMVLAMAKVGLFLLVFFSHPSPLLYYPRSNPFPFSAAPPLLFCPTTSNSLLLSDTRSLPPPSPGMAYCVFLDLRAYGRRQVADPKTIGHVTPSQIHHMKELADEYVAIETRITTEYEASLPRP